MRFRIKSTSFKISFTFFAVILLVICFDNKKILLSSLVFSLLHELVHVAFIYLYGGGIDEFSLTLFGGNIKRKQNYKSSNIKEAIISLSAPATNLFVGALLLLHGFQTPGYVNLVLGIFNLLPFYDFDGGRGLYYVLCDRLDNKIIIKILNVTSVLSVAFIATVTVTLFFNQKTGFSLLFLSIYMIFSLFKNLSSENV